MNYGDINYVLSIQNKHEIWQNLAKFGKNHFPKRLNIASIIIGSTFLYCIG
jgi:hypothetical protein